MIELKISDLANEDYKTLCIIRDALTSIINNKIPIAFVGSDSSITEELKKQGLKMVNEQPMFTEEELKPIEATDTFLEQAANMFNQAPIVIPPPISQTSGCVEHAVEFEGTGYSGQTVDSAGQPWDANLHSRGKSTTKDGRWRVKREEKNSKNSMPLFSTTIASTGTAVSAPPVTPPPTNVTPQAEFQAIMKKTTELMAAKKLTREKVTEILNSFNIPSLTIIATTPYLHLIPAVSAAFDEAAK